MRHPTVTILLTLAVLLFNTTEGWSLPPCPGSFETTWTNCVGTFTFSNGNKYFGEFRYGKINGKGTYTYTNGDKYVGENKDNKWHGQGT